MTSKAAAANSLLTGQVNHASDTEARNILSGTENPVLVFFGAPWCGSCVAFAPVLDEIAADLKNKIVVVKIDMEENQEVGNHYGVRSLPTSMVFKSGQLMQTKIGVSSKSDMIKFIKEAVKA